MRATEEIIKLKSLDRHQKEDCYPKTESKDKSGIDQICVNWIKRLNEEYAVVNLAGDTVILHEVVNPATGYADVEFSNVSAFNQYFANKKVSIVETNCNGESKKKNVSISKIWFESPKRRQYLGVVFNPSSKEHINGYYNLFRGFGVKPKKGDWSLMQNHIRLVIANGDGTVNKYVMAFCADLVQNPGGRRPGVALVLCGPQGVGKGAFVSNLGQTVGAHYVQVSDPNHFTGRFNAHLKDKILIFVDEGIWAGNRSLEGKLKAYITEETFLVEPKGVNAFQVKNHMRFIIASNNDWVVPAGLDERRMFVLDVNPRHQRDYEYFNKLFHQMDNGGREAMLYDLINYDCSDVNLREFPRTEALLDQMMRSATITEKFWFERLQAGCLLADGEDFWTARVEIDSFYESCIEFSKRIGQRYPPDKSQFGRELKRICPPVKRVRPRRSDGIRQYEYEFPSLDECRMLFEEKINLKIDWED